MRMFYKFLAIFIVTCAFTPLVKAQTWDAPTPDGSVIATATSYYVFNVGAKAFLDRGGEWASQAVVFPTDGAKITLVQSSALWTLQFESSAKTLFPANTVDGWTYTDNSGSNTWDIQVTDATNNIYSIQINNLYGGYNASQYLGASSSTYSSNSGVVYDVRYNRAASDYTKWKFCTADAVAKYNAKVKLDKFMKIAKLTGSAIDLTSYITTYNTGTTADINTAAANLNTALAPVDKTSSITNPAFASSPATGWTTTNTGYGYANTEVEYYQKTFDMNQTISSLSPGIYILKAQGYERPAGLSTTTQSWYANGWDSRSCSLYATAAGSTTTVPMRSLFSETTNTAGTTINGLLYPNSMAQGFTAFTTNGLYDNELSYFVVDATGSAKIGLAGTYRSNGSYVMSQWILFDNFRLYYYGALAVPNLSCSKASLSFNNSTANNNTFDLTGSNLTADVNISAPSGVTLSGTNLINNGGGNYSIALANANSTNTITVTWDETTNIRSVNISVSSTDATTQNVSVVASADNGCFTQTYPGLTNIVTEPYMNSLSAYSSSWGNAALSTSTVYCGAYSGTVTGTRSGSITYPLTGKWKTNTTYRIISRVKVVSGTYNLNVSGWSGASSDIVNTITPTSITYNDNSSVSVTEGTWNTVDFKFTTGATINSGNQFFYFNNYSSNTAGEGYIDNIEMYVVPKIYSSPSSLTFLGLGDKKVAIRAENLSENITISAPAGYSVSPTSMLKTVTGSETDSLTVTFSGPNSASGYVYFTSGSVIDSLYVSGTVAPTVSTDINKLNFDETATTGSFVVNGGNLTSDITITAPAGITTNPTSIPMGAATNVTVNVIYDGTTSNVSGNIALTSGSATANVAVLASKNTDCFTALYSSHTNYVTDPYLNSIPGAWGNVSLAEGSEAYCGKNSIKIAGTAQCWPNGGSISTPSVTWAPNSTYRFHAMVKTMDGTFNMGVQNANVGGGSGDYNIEVPNTNGVWTEFTATFVSGSSPGSGVAFFNNCGASTGMTAYIDNWELYDISDIVMGNSVNPQHKIYASSVGGNVTIHGLKTGESVRIFTINGQMVQAFNSTGNQYDVKLGSGVYFVKTNGQVVKILVSTL